MTTLTPTTATPALSGWRLELELTGRCNLTCAHCYAESGPNIDHGTMTVQDWSKVIMDAADLGVSGVQFIGGEPTMYPEFTASPARDSHRPVGGSVQQSRTRTG